MQIVIVRLRLVEFGGDRASNKTYLKRIDLLLGSLLQPLFKTDEKFMTSFLTIDIIL